MADSKLSALTELALAPAGTDEFYINDGLVSKRITFATLSEAIFSSAEATKLAGIETGADVTDAANVAAAGAVMDTDFSLGNQIIKADSANTPVALTVGEQTLVGRITAGSIAALTGAQARGILNVEDGADVTDATNVNAAGAVMDTDFGANQIIKADSASTPTALTVGEQTLVGRITAGVIAALTAAQVRTLINVEDGATADQTAADIRTLGFFDTSNDGTGSGLDADLLDGQHASAFEASDADIVKADVTKTLAVGYQDTAVDNGTKTTGTFTPTIASGNLQNVTIGGSITLGVPSGEGIIVMIVRNNATGGYTFTTSGWDKVIGVYDSAANAVMVMTLIMDSTGDVLLISDSV